MWSLKVAVDLQSEEKNFWKATLQSESSFLFSLKSLKNTADGNHSKKVPMFHVISNICNAIMSARDDGDLVCRD